MVRVSALVPLLYLNLNGRLQEALLSHVEGVRIDVSYVIFVAYIISASLANFNP